MKSCNSITTKCILTLVNLASGPYLWGDFHKNFQKGKKSWAFKPFPINYQDNLNTAGKVKLAEFKGEYIPKLLIGKAENPYDLLLTVNHELYHYANIAESAKDFYEKGKVNGCVTRYQLSLAKDEEKAFLSEIDFFKKAPKWFKDGVSKLKLNSKLLSLKQVSYSDYYKQLESRIRSERNFILKRYIELGEYPSCMINLL